MTESIQKIYLDTNVFAYAFERSPAEMQHLHDLFAVLRERPRVAVTSELTLAELLGEGNKNSLSPKRRFYLDLIVWSRFIELQPVTRGVLLETADLRQHAKLKLPDAIHIVTAIRAKCQYFVSEDHDARKLPMGMKHVKPNTIADVQFILDALRA
ncbi:MAG: type II toxin-antitoxin system VapC family toxin [Methylovirgula sp.]